MASRKLPEPRSRKSPKPRTTNPLGNRKGKFAGTVRRTIDPPKARNPYDRYKPS